MNNANPLIPQGSTIESKHAGRSRVRLAVFCVLAAHLVLLGTVLVVQGCKREEAPPPAVADTNPPPPIIESSTPPSDLSTLPVPAGTTDGATPPSLEPTQASVPVPPPATQEYTVLKGDTFYDIAKKFGTTTKAISDANPTVDPARLQINQRILIPPASANPTAPATHSANGTTGGVTYKVVSGDTLTKIAADHGVTVKALRAANNLTTDRIVVGQSLKIPAKPAPAPPPATP